jgi:hypothetical protein
MPCSDRVRRCARGATTFADELDLLASPRASALAASLRA